MAVTEMAYLSDNLKKEFCKYTFKNINISALKIY